jgi:hypothetical protein
MAICLYYSENVFYRNCSPELLHSHLDYTYIAIDVLNRTRSQIPLYCHSYSYLAGQYLCFFYLQNKDQN